MASSDNGNNDGLDGLDGLMEYPQYIAQSNQQYPGDDTPDYYNPVYSLPVYPGYPYNPYPCFLTGTAISTPDGARSVESLAIGDEITTATGVAKPVKWIGRRTVSTRFADRLASFPVVVQAGALAQGVPARDLFLSPDHALLVEGVLIQASALVNGLTVRQLEQLPEERFTYWHVELEDHDLILAEGTPAETFVDNLSRRSFDNWAEYQALYGSEGEIAEMALPRVTARRQLSSTVTATLRERAAELSEGSPKVA
jgi:hypothetical protein